MEINKKIANIIVHIEDEESFREIIKELVNEIGYHYVSFANGEDALAHFINHKNNTALLNRIDCIICDYSMPVMNGDEFILKFKELKLDIPILGNSSSLTYNAELLKAGADNFIEKNLCSYFHQDTFKQAIKEIKG